jgi:hypothetical protein
MMRNDTKVRHNKEFQAELTIRNLLRHRFLALQMYQQRGSSLCITLSSVAIANCWTAGIRFPQGQKIFLYSTAFRPTLGPIHPLNQRVQGALTMGVKRPRCEADHLPPSIAEVKNGVLPSLAHMCS